MPNGFVHIPPDMLPAFSAYASTKLAALDVFTFLQAEYPPLVRLRFGKVRWIFPKYNEQTRSP